MSAQPWMKFYPSDWRGSTSLKLVSMAARGLWIEMLCIMHEAEPYGHLIHKGRAVTPQALASLVGASLEEVTSWLSELTENGVADVKRNGVVYSKRMEGDEIKRGKNRDNGKKGGNPSLGKHEENTDPVNPQVNTEDKAQRPETRDQKPKETPSGVSARGSRISDGWTPGDLGTAYAAKAGFGDQAIAAMAERFANYWRAKSGKDAVKVDWAATWRNWVLSEADRKGAAKAAEKRVSWV